MHVHRNVKRLPNLNNGVGRTNVTFATPPRSMLPDTVARVKAAFLHRNANDKQQAVKHLGDEVSSLPWTSDDLLEELCTSSRFSENPNLALHYYHGLSCDHSAWLYNDESLDTPAVVTRIENALEEPIGKPEAIAHHTAMKRTSDDIRACASCNEMLVAKWGDAIISEDISKVPMAIHYTPEETEALLLCGDVVRKHRMVVEHGNPKTFYHLNPELVHGDRVFLCKSCQINPRGPATSVFSIANGYDPGLYRHLNRDLKPTTKRCIASLRGFKAATLSVRDRLKRGHVIIFPTDAPPQVAATLPWTEDALPQVSFYGTPVQWASAKGQFLNHTTFDVKEVYEYLEVLKKVHCDYGNIVFRPWQEVAAEVRSTVAEVIFPPEKVLQSTGDLGGATPSDDKFTMRYSAMVKPPGETETMTDLVGGAVEKGADDEPFQKGMAEVMVACGDWAILSATERA